MKRLLALLLLPLLVIEPVLASYVYNSGGTKFHDNSSPPITSTAADFFVGCWLKFTTLPGTSGEPAPIIGFYTDGSANNQVYVGVDTSNHPYARTRNTGSATATMSGVTVADTTSYHFIGMASAAGGASRTVYFDATGTNAPVTESTTRSVTGMNRLRLAFDDGTTNQRARVKLDYCVYLPRIPSTGEYNSLVAKTNPQDLSGAVVWTLENNVNPEPSIPAGVSLSQDGALTFDTDNAGVNDPTPPAPTFSVAPTVQSQTAVAYTLAYTASTSATFYAVACIKDSTAPTIAQVKAGDCTGNVDAIAAANEAVTGADTTVLGSALTRPIHDLYAVLSNAGGDTTLQTLADEYLDPPAGKQFEALTSIEPTSVCTDPSISPAIAAGDIVVIDAVTDPRGDAVNITSDCTITFDSDGSRQLTLWNVYDVSAGDFIAASARSLWWNNQPPVPPPDANAPYIFPLNQAIDELDLTTLCTDSEGDAITVTNVDALPPGLSITDSVMSGTPTVAGIYRDVAFRCMDITGAATDFE